MNSEVIQLPVVDRPRIDISCETATLFRSDADSRLFLIIDNREQLTARKEDLLWEWIDAALRDLGYIPPEAGPDFTIGPFDYYFLTAMA